MRTMSGDPCLHYDCTNRNSFGYCKTTACINPKYSNIGTAQYGQGVQKRIATNADRIRSMSDEELAELIFDCVACDDCPVGSKKCKREFVKCKDAALCWMKQESTNEST